MHFLAAPSRNSWRPVMSSVTTELSYWLKWRFFFCAVLVMFTMAVASIMIWKYEGSEQDGEEEEEEEDAAWRPCLRTVHPAWLLVFRIVAFIIFVSLIVADLVVDGASNLWTGILVTIYFGLGLLLSAYGCHKYVRVTAERINPTSSDAESGSSIAPADIETSTDPLRMKNTTNRKHLNIHKIVRLGGYLFQIIYQANAGALLLTDFVFWLIIFPFLAIKNYDLSFRFRWFRMSYFMLWTSIYVIFQWVIHACISIWWPYTFLDLSKDKSPIWYLAVAVLHIPCYAVFHFIIKLKHYLFLRWFHNSYYLIN
ncbi:uncharacterized protein LOC110100697 [Dendrobium catenatum]|uniref:uncharacterized protein LOC110100697 n=1 Tax=Dendrobium catenatum TaxID=906689 RepID=UPI0010A048E1|nr:uncharacterized protein LOC110100697 [Dendrobium catenatum]